MLLSMFRRKEIESGDPQLMGGAISDQFMRNISTIGAWSDVEHDDDGRHTDVTAKSLAVAGNAAVLGQLTAGTLASPVNIGMVPGQPVDLAGPVLPGGVTDYNNGPPPAVGVSADESRACLTTDRDFLPSQDDKFNLGLEGTGALNRRWQGIVVSKTVRGKDLWASNRFWEGNRIAAMGYWQTVPYNSNNFLADGATGVWGVEAGDSAVYKYTLIGKTLIVTYEINATSLSVASVRLGVKLPAGIVAAAGTVAAAVTYFGAMGAGTGFVEMGGGATQFNLLRDIAGTAWPVSSNNLYVRGQFVGEIA